MYSAQSLLLLSREARDLCAESPILPREARGLCAESHPLSLGRPETSAQSLISLPLGRPEVSAQSLTLSSSERPEASAQSLTSLFSGRPETSAQSLVSPRPPRLLCALCAPVSIRSSVILTWRERKASFRAGLPS